MDVESHTSMIDSASLEYFATHRAEVRHLINSYSLIRSSYRLLVSTLLE
jgi:hypothetical protein